MYGMVVSYKDYLELDGGHTIEEVLINTNEVQGVFTGRDSDFVIMGRVLKEVDETTEEPHEVPTLKEWEEDGVRIEVFTKFHLPLIKKENFHYYYITR